MYTLLLYHQSRPGISRNSLTQHWRQERFSLVLSLQKQLGFQRYSQIHPLPHYNLLYQGLRLSRHPRVMALFSQKNQTSAQYLETTNSEASTIAWDGIDRFLYESKDTLIQAITSLSGQSAAEQLKLDTAPYVRHSIAIATEEFVVASNPNSTSPRLVNIYSLHSTPNLNRAEMLTYWSSKHRKLVLDLHSALKYQAYEQLHVQESADLQPVIQAFGEAPHESFDGVASLAYGSESDLTQAFLSLNSQCANVKLIQDEVTFLDTVRSSLLLGYEYDRCQSAPIHHN